MVVSHHAKFQLITTTGSRFFRTVFVEILRPPLLALVPEAGLRNSGSDVRGSREISLSSREDFLPTLACVAGVNGDGEGEQERGRRGTGG